MNMTEEFRSHRICEECGREFEVNDFNKFAPYAMCDNCYDAYVVNNFDPIDYHEF